MVDVEGLFDLSREGVAELAIEIVDMEQECRIVSGAVDLFEVANCTAPDERRDPIHYHTFICQTTQVGERETTELADPISGATVGYVFPVTAFRDSENFDGLWRRRFADVGFRYATALPRLSAFGAVVSIESLRDRRVFLDEVLQDALSVVVMGKEACDRLAVDADTLELMLFKQGISIVRSPSDVQSQPISVPWSSRKRLVKPGSLVADESAIFLTLLRSADRDQTGVGAFMHIYQALEFCIDHIFGWGVSKIAREELDTWQMKERLSRITGESHRLSLLDAECLLSLPNRASLNELSDACGGFLSVLNVKYDVDAPWHTLLYKCRNIIVHNQIMMMKEKNLPLRPLVNALRAAALEILFCFCMPTPREPVERQQE